MIFLREINPLSAKLLERIYHQSRYHEVRQKAHCLLLANQGIKVEELMKIFQVSYRTIYNWFDKWELEGIRGLYSKKGRGSKPKFNQEQKEKIKEWTKQEPRQLKRIVEKVSQFWILDFGF